MLSQLPKAHRSKMETVIISPSELSEWMLPDFQRPLRVNAKVKQIAKEMIDNSGTIQGVITLGIIGNKPGCHFLVDGQHRREAALLSGLDAFIADIRICNYADMAEMGEDFVSLNTAIVKMRPDDILRGIEQKNEALKYIRNECPFVGYDNLRRREGSPIISMASMLRTWRASSKELPTIASTGGALSIAESLTTEETAKLVKFLNIAFDAWGRDPVNNRLWGSLNLTICMWLFRRLVLIHDKDQIRHIRLSVEEFRRCLMGLSASPTYVDWLTGRNMTDRDRAPCYSRVKAIFVKRLVKDESATRSSARLPQPDWSWTGRSGRR